MIKVIKNYKKITKRFLKKHTKKSNQIMNYISCNYVINYELCIFKHMNKHTMTDKQTNTDQQIYRITDKYTK